MVLICYTHLNHSDMWHRLTRHGDDLRPSRDERDLTSTHGHWRDLDHRTRGRGDMAGGKQPWWRCVILLVFSA